jgi:hypothetical protein
MRTNRSASEAIGRRPHELIKVISQTTSASSTTQDKADAQRDAAKKEAETDAARRGAKAAEERQKEHQ